MQSTNRKENKVTKELEILNSKYQDLNFNDELNGITLKENIELMSLTSDSLDMITTSGKYTNKSHMIIQINIRYIRKGSVIL